MSKRLLLLGTALVLLFHSSAEASPRILSGTEVQSPHFESTVALVGRKAPFSSKGKFCGGTLIRPRWVLTAAHCATEKSWRWTDVVVGRKDLSVAGGQRIAVSAVRIHPRSKAPNAPTPPYDFALLRLAKPARAEPIKRLHRGRIRGGKQLFVAGWGETEYGTYPSRLQEVSVRTFSHNLCQKKYSAGSSVFCAGRTEGEFDACYGDSGGPIVSREGAKEVLWGLVSFGRDCGLPGWPGGYAKISSALPWMNRILSSSPRGHRVKAGQDAFPESPDKDLGPLTYFITDTYDWHSDPETPYLFIIRIGQGRKWPFQTAYVSVKNPGIVCGDEGWCNQTQWPMYQTIDGEWRVFLYSSEPCIEIEATVMLRREKSFSYEEAACHPPSR